MDDFSTIVHHAEYIRKARDLKHLLKAINMLGWNALYLANLEIWYLQFFIALWITDIGTGDICNSNEKIVDADMLSISQIGSFVINNGIQDAVSFL